MPDHVQKKTRYDENNRQWSDEHITNGTLAEIRGDLEQYGVPSDN